MSNRKAAEAQILADIEAILPGSQNGQMYQALFASMDDKAFDRFMQQLEDDELVLNLIAPNMSSPRLETERNLNTGEAWGHNWFERIWMPMDDGTTYLSNDRYLVYDEMLRRQAQLVEKKISVAEDAKSVDDFTGQATGKSKGSKLSFPELQLIAANGLIKTAEELIKWRGGDVKGYAAMIDQISNTGGVSMKAIAPHAGGVIATQTLKTLLTCMHLQNTL